MKANKKYFELTDRFLLGCIFSLQGVQLIRSSHDSISFILSILVWLVGLAIIVKERLK